VKKLTTVLILILLVQTPCDKFGKDCGECFTPHPSFIFEFIDKDNGENLFTNKTFDVDKVSVTDKDGKSHEFELMTEDDINVLILRTVGLDLEPNTYTIKLNEKTSVKFDLDIDKKHTECCTYFEVKTFVIYDYEIINNSYTIIVKI